MTGVLWSAWYPEVGFCTHTPSPQEPGWPDADFLGKAPGSLAKQPWVVRQRRGFPPVSFLLSATPGPKTTWGGMGLFDLHFQVAVCHWEKPRQKPEAQTKEELFLLAPLAALGSPSFLIQLRATC